MLVIFDSTYCLVGPRARSKDGWGDMEVKSSKLLLENYGPKLIGWIVDLQRFLVSKEGELAPVEVIREKFGLGIGELKQPSFEYQMSIMKLLNGSRIEGIYGYKTGQWACLAELLN
jgi:hypothetical protein